MRWRMWRRSVSSWVSPGPRVPIGLLPPPAVWRTRWVHMPASRGRIYWYCASSTCSLPSPVRARWAKISRMSAERSSTVHLVSSSRLRVCEGDRSLSNRMRLASFASASCRTSSALPSPIKVRGSGAGTALQRHRDRFRARGLGQRAQLVHRALIRVLIGVKARAGQPDQHGALMLFFQTVFGHSVSSSAQSGMTKQKAIEHTFRWLCCYLSR